LRGNEVGSSFLLTPGKRRFASASPVYVSFLRNPEIWNVSVVLGFRTLELPGTRSGVSELLTPVRMHPSSFAATVLYGTAEDTVHRIGNDEGM
jgi:hypothetical protein